MSGARGGRIGRKKLLQDRIRELDGERMESLLAHTDALLRPDVGLVLPTIAAYTGNWVLVVLAAAVQPLKWQSGCGCFVELCARKRFSVRAGAALGAAAAAAHFGLGLGVTDGRLFAAAAAALFGTSRESWDTRALKAALMGLAYAAPAGWAGLGAAGVCAGYAWGTGWRVRAGRHRDVLAGNAVWLITRDGRLAKRLNNYGEFHLEYERGGEVVLVGEGRLVGARGEGLKTGLRLDGFVREEGNVELLERLVESGRVVVKGDSVGLVQ